MLNLIYKKLIYKLYYMSNSYKLVNPYIKGDFQTKIKSKNSLNAAKEFYGSLSEHFNNNVPKFYFTIQKGGGKKFYHFEVTENKKKENVNYSIKPYTLKNNESVIDNYLDNFKAFKGRFNRSIKKKHKSRSNSSKHKSRSNSSKRKSRSNSSKRKSKRTSKHKSKRKSRSNSSEDLVNRIEDTEEEDFYRDAIVTVPVTSSPISYLYYDPLVYALDSIFIPTFYAYLSPYVELNTRKGSYTYGVVVNN
jgi:hypothetical protein